MALKALARSPSSWLAVTGMAVVRSPSATRRVPSTRAATGRSTRRRLSHQMIRLLARMASAARLSSTERLVRICRSAWTMDRFTSSTPSTFCWGLWAWQSAVQHDGSLGMGLMMPRMREPSGARKIRDRCWMSSFSSGWPSAWHM